MNTTELKKDYTIAFEQRPQYLFAHIKGERGTFAIAHAYWSEIVQTTLETGFKKVLVIEDIPEAISIAEVHQLVSDFADLPVKDIRLAFIDKYPQHKTLNDFGILVGANRGLTVRSFDDETEAEAWLLGGDKS